MTFLKYWRFFVFLYVCIYSHKPLSSSGSLIRWFFFFDFLQWIFGLWISMTQTHAFARWDFMTMSFIALNNQRWRTVLHQFMMTKADRVGQHAVQKFIDLSEAVLTKFACTFFFELILLYYSSLMEIFFFWTFSSSHYRHQNHIFSRLWNVGFWARQAQTLLCRLPNGENHDLFPPKSFDIIEVSDVYRETRSERESDKLMSEGSVRSRQGLARCCFSDVLPQALSLAQGRKSWSSHVFPAIQVSGKLASKQQNPFRFTMRLAELHKNSGFLTGQAGLASTSPRAVVRVHNSQTFGKICEKHAVSKTADTRIWGGQAKISPLD